MKARRLLSVMAAAALSAALFTGCGSKIPPNTVFSLDDLNGKVIGVQTGTTGDIYASDVTDNVELFDTGAAAVAALKEGKLDAVMIDLEPAKVYVEQNSDLRILEESFAVEEYAIAVKKGNDELKDKINDALAQLSTNGTLDAIKANWIGETAGQNPYTSPADADRSNGTLIVATNAEFPPYESVENEAIVGLDIDMMQAVCDVLGMNLNVRNMDFDSILTTVDAGNADVGVAGITVNEDRKTIVNFTDSYTTSTQVIIVRADRIAE